MSYHYSAVPAIWRWLLNVSISVLVVVSIFSVASHICRVNYDILFEAQLPETIQDHLQIFNIQMPEQVVLEVDCPKDSGAGHTNISVSFVNRRKSFDFAAAMIREELRLGYNNDTGRALTWLQQ